MTLEHDPKDALAHLLIQAQGAMSNPAQSVVTFHVAFAQLAHSEGVGRSGF